MTGQKAFEEFAYFWWRKTGSEPPFDAVPDPDVGKRSPILDGNNIRVFDGEISRYEKADMERAVKDMFRQPYRDILMEEAEEQLGILGERHPYMEDDIPLKSIKIGDPSWKPMDSGMLYKGDGRIVVHPLFISYIDLETGEFSDPEDWPEIPRALRHELSHGLHHNANPEAREEASNHGPMQIGSAPSEALPMYEMNKGYDEEGIDAVEDPWSLPRHWEEEIAGHDSHQSDPHGWGELVAWSVEEAYLQNDYEEEPEEATRMKLVSLVDLEDMDEAYCWAMEQLDRPNYLEIIEHTHEFAKGKNLSEMASVFDEYLSMVDDVEYGVRGLEKFYQASALHTVWEKSDNPMPEEGERLERELDSIYQQTSG